ncbi:MAG: dicarboxylate/amino acid:cation symporter [Planctomycetota bacterium]
MDSAATSPRRSLATRILVGLVLGATAGLLCNLGFAPPPGEPTTPAYDWVVWVADKVMNPLGQVFLRMLFMVVVPLVLSSLILGVASVGDLGRVGRIGARTLLWFVLSTALAVALGLLLVNLFAPGKGLDPDVAVQLRAQFQQAVSEKVEQAQKGTGFSLDTFVNIVPKNVVRAAVDDREVLGVIFFAVMVGIAVTQLARETVAPLLAVLEALYSVCVKILGYAMRLAPYGVFALIFATSAKLGLPLLRTLGTFVAVALTGLLLHLFVVLGLAAKLLVGVPPLRFFSRCRSLAITAFSTSSSNATLPTTIRTATDEFGVPSAIAGFVLPLGATMNMNGTALFEGVSVLFLAQVYGADLSLGQQAFVVVLAVLTAIGTAGVPGGSLPLLAVVLMRFDIPPEYLGLILGVDRLLDMARTMPNVVSDLLCSMWVAKREGAVLKT